MTGKEIITFRDVHAHYGRQRVLQQINLHISLGEFVYIVGPTGVGKSTILKLIYADCPLAQGTLQVEKFALHQIKLKEIPFLRRKLGIVFQDFQLLPEKTVVENIVFAMKASGWKGNTRIKQRITEVLVSVGMSGKAHAYPHQLSGGQQQRVAIARALINHPIVLIADEPTGNLDPVASQHIMEILQKINQGGTTILMATHEYPIIRQFPGRILEVLPGGTLKEHADAAGFLQGIY